MKILMICHRLPYPPNKGEKIRSYHELKYLAERHDLWCAALTDDEPSADEVECVRAMCRAVAVAKVRPAVAALRGALSVTVGGTFTEGYFRTHRLRDVVDQWSREVRFDAVLAFGSSVARLGLRVDAPRRIVDFCDIDSAKWSSYAKLARGPKRWLYQAEANRLARCELELARAYDVALVISPREASAFRAIEQRLGASEAGAPPCRVRVVRNGIDLEAYPFAPLPAGPPTVGFVGTMDYPPNVDAVCWFAESVWPRVRERVPDARFLVVGRSPSHQVRALAERAGIDVTGSVRDIVAYLHEMHVCVVPTRIVHGLQNKVLEAMAAGRAVVVTPPVAESIGEEPTPGLLVAAEPSEFAARVSGLLCDREACRTSGEAGRSFVAERFQWDDALARLEEDL